MRTLRKSVGAFVALAFLSGSGFTQELRVREIPYRYNIPLETRLLDDDEVVVMVRNEDAAVFSGRWNPAQVLAYAVQTSDIIVLVDVDDVSSALTRDKSWIRTQVSGAAVEVLFSLKGTVSQGAPIAFQQDSGEITIGKCLVRAGIPLEAKAGRRYLMFLGRDSYTGALYLTYGPVLLENGKLVSPGKPGGRRGDFDGLTLEKIAADIRKLAKRK